MLNREPIVTRCPDCGIEFIVPLSEKVSLQLEFEFSKGRTEQLEAQLRYSDGIGRKVHNHGPEEGPGLTCKEHVLDGRLLGECLLREYTFHSETFEEVGISSQDYVALCGCIFGNGEPIKRCENHGGK